MKKIVKKMMWSAFALCAVICLEACSKNEPTTGEVTGKITYELGEVYDLKDLMDISVTYTNAEGKDVAENLTVSPWKKTIENAKIPFTAHLKIVYKRKSNIAYTKDSYKVGKTQNITYELSDGTLEDGYVIATPLTISKDKIEAYLIKLEGNPLEQLKEIKVRL